MDLNINNVINVTTTITSGGLNNYNTSNLGYITRDQSTNATFNSSGYALYNNPYDVGLDFGTQSLTYKSAVTVFSQSPNILTGGGLFVALKRFFTQSTLTYSLTPATGSYNLNITSTVSATPFVANILATDTAASIQAKIQALSSSLASVTVTLVSNVLTINYGVSKVSLIQVTANTLEDASTPAVAITIAIVNTYKTVAQTISESVGLVEYFGVMSDQVETGPTLDDNIIAASVVISALNKLFFYGVNDPVQLQETTGIFDLVRLSSFTKSRGLFYYDSNVDNVTNYVAAYASRLLSVNFSASNSTNTAQLKQLTGILPDPNMTQSLRQLALLVGADIYPSIQGSPRILSSGANLYFDQVYNRGWISGAIQIAIFNFLSSPTGKIPQTESAMDAFKSVIVNVCEQAKVNGYVAPNPWNSATTFGNLEDFLNNILQQGYYIYSLPIAQQSQADRVARIAPMVQVAIKEAGAIHQASIIININA